MEEAKKTTHWLIGGILMFVGALVVVALVIIYSQADSVSTQTNIDNVNPNVDSIFLSTNEYGKSSDFGSGIGLTANGDKTIHINGIVSDTNGAADINIVSLDFYRSGLQNDCPGDKNDCYHVASCNQDPDTATTKDYDCAINLPFFTDATDTDGPYSGQNWVAQVKVTDKNTGNDVDSATVEVNTMLSTTIPSSINYGLRTNNSKTTTDDNQAMVIPQQGNDQLDITVAMSAADMTCTGGSGVNIPRGNQKWALTDVGYDDVSSTALSDTTTDTQLHLDYRTDDGAPKTKPIYWNIFVPYGAGGTCSGTTTINAIAQELP